MTTRVLYDLCAADPAVRLSPYCWRAKLALAHKGLAYEARPWRFTERDTLGFSGQGKVPVLVDGETVVADSFAIARHLEQAYPQAPTLFPGGVAAARFVATWADTVLNAGLARMVVADICAALDGADAAYFRESREVRFGGRLEDVQAGREDRLDAFRASLAPLRAALGEAPYLAGESPAYGDYVIAGSFQWAHAISAFDPLAPEDPVHAWRERMRGLFDGLMARAPRSAAA
ncbi:MAG: glutathione S-transferase N-terminal domain-containing protein [Salinarimonas sp.]